MSDSSRLGAKKNADSCDWRQGGQAGGLTTTFSEITPIKGRDPCQKYFTRLKQRSSAASQSEEREALQHVATRSELLWQRIAWRYPSPAVNRQHERILFPQSRVRFMTTSLRAHLVVGIRSLISAESDKVHKKSGSCFTHGLAATR